ncbi:NADH:flavin oxidoreductase/NADH oxidase [Saccharopolyspora hattusasensis]|uniref:oxidoreductase n=1 Tax=Saccharopolyspora hattusasensis TaxID=1128679 RepID=UPI003D9596DC
MTRQTNSVADELKIRSVTMPNRLWMAPMSQYSSPPDGGVADWHLIHLGARAVGGAGLILTEATAVTPVGRMSESDLGIWSDDHVDGLTRLTGAIEASGAVAGIQFGHAGPKASAHRPWEARGIRVPPENGGWLPQSPSARPGGSPVHEMSAAEITDIVTAFADAARRALAAGFRVLEIHAAHGYLIHSFLSPATNRRDDRYGGEQGRRRLAIEVVTAVREVWPEWLPLFVRLSATDWLTPENGRPNGLDVDDVIDVVQALLPLGVDLIDVSSGGLLPTRRIDTYPGYQIPFASKIRQATSALVAGVGLIEDAQHAESIVRGGAADALFVGRAMLRNPNWARDTLHQLGHRPAWPRQYDWAIGPRKVLD